MLTGDSLCVFSIEYMLALCGTKSVRLSVAHLTFPGLRSCPLRKDKQPLFGGINSLVDAKLRQIFDTDKKMSKKR